MSRRYFPKLEGTEARTLAFLALYRVYEEGAYSNLALQGILKSDDIPPTTRAAVTAMVLGALSKTVTADYILNQRLKKKLDRLQPAVRTVLRLAVWELFWSNQKNTAAITNEACLLVKKIANQGAVGLVNAVLRGLLREPVTLPDKNMAVQYGLISELAGLFKKWYKTDAPGLLEALAEPADLVVRARSNFVLQTGAADETGAIFRPARFMPGAYRLDLGQLPVTALPAFKAGRLTVQGEASMLPATLSGLAAGGLAWDICAAPGSKTLQLAEQVGAEGMVLASDINPSRIRLLQENKKRFGLAQIKVLLHDATSPLPPDLAGRMDAVLADVPCSGLGRLASRPELRFRMTYNKIRELYPLQAAILDRAGEAVRRGGRLIYSTCTLNPAENEERVQAFLAQNRAFQALDLRGQLPAALLELDPSLCETAERGWVTLRPDRHGCEGFFVSVMTKA